MALRSIADTVNALNNSVQRCIISYRVVSAVEVIVYRTRKADAAQIVLLSEVARTRQRTISTNDDERIDIVSYQVLISFFPTFVGHELFRAGRLQDSTAGANDTTYILCSKITDFTVDQTVVASINSFDFKSIVNTSTGHRTDSSIHAGGIASRCQNAYCLNFRHFL